MDFVDSYMLPACCPSLLFMPLPSNFSSEVKRKDHAGYNFPAHVQTIRSG